MKRLNQNSLLRCMSSTLLESPRSCLVFTVLFWKSFSNVVSVACVSLYLYLSHLWLNFCLYVLDSLSRDFLFALFTLFALLLCDFLLVCFVNLFTLLSSDFLLLLFEVKTLRLLHTGHWRTSSSRDSPRGTKITYPSGSFQWPRLPHHFGCENQSVAPRSSSSFRSTTTRPISNIVPHCNPHCLGHQELSLKGGGYSYVACLVLLLGCFLLYFESVCLLLFL